MKNILFLCIILSNFPLSAMFNPGALIADAPTDTKNDLSYLESKVAPFRYEPWSKHPILIYKHQSWTTKNDFKFGLKLIRKELETDRFGNCFTYAITEILGITNQTTNKLFISHPEYIITKCNILQYFNQIPMPKPGCLAVYSDYTREIKHFAVVTKAPNKTTCYVKGKWGSCVDIEEHELFHAPEVYGDQVSFYELMPQYNNKKDLLSLIQKSLKESLKNEQNINKLKELMIQFAQNNNIASKFIDVCTSQTNIYGKSIYLFKHHLGLSVNTRDNNGKTLTMLAAENNNIPLLKLLLDMGAHRNAQDKNGNTALHLAQQKDNDSATYTLLSYGANPHIKNNDNKKITLYNELDEKISARYMLLLHIANKDNRINFDAEEFNNQPMRDQPTHRQLRCILRNGPALNLNLREPENDITLLMIAANSGDCKAVQTLITYGANPSIVNKYGNKALDYAKLSSDKKTIDYLSQYENN